MNEKMKVLGIIPARFASTRFPGKPLADINGISMIERVFRQAKKSTALDEVIVATDDARIEAAVKQFGGRVMMTADTHESGTDRCLEALDKEGGSWDVILNIQGDEPMLDPRQVDQLVSLMQHGTTGIGTLVKEITDEEEVHNPNVVKVVLTKNSEALYFSRAAIPYNRNSKKGNWLEGSIYYKHIGIYGYRTETLRQITAMNKSKLEITESLEQLRWLENGFAIMAAVSPFDNLAVDTPEDLDKMIRMMNA